ncbi:hypothetical protein QC761_306835 [Podospora bellae-mahoneyi]|uniref:Uncharacterized protein n=1 Tax=Podospora bellae-mahoneyi TaxID=2093777 RepID=A0ABR0FNV8_9PEZI|nr:hypothetical protein QC761_306835 [Podospora bellae-mahoneyi]
MPTATKWIVVSVFVFWKKLAGRYISSAPPCTHTQEARHIQSRKDRDTPEAYTVDLSPNNYSLTPETLDENLAKFREWQAGFTCPEAEPGRLIETMLFDLNCCDCLRYTQLDRLGGTWHRAQTPLQTTLRSLAKSCLFGKHCQHLGPLTKAQVQQHCQNKPTRGQRQACRKDFVKQAHVMTVGISKPCTEDTAPFCMDRTIALPCRGGGL